MLRLHGHFGFVQEDRPSIFAAVGVGESFQVVKDPR